MIGTMPLNLCLASPHFFPTYGGSQLRFQRYMPGLRRRNILVSVVTGTPKAQESANTKEFEACEMNAGSTEDGLIVRELKGVPIHRIRLYNRPGWRRSITYSHGLYRYCLSNESRPDVLQMIPSLQPRSAPWLHAIRKNLMIPIVYGYTVMVEAPANPVKRAFRHWSLRRLYREMDCIVVGSSVLHDSLRKIGTKIRIEVIPNGVNLERFQPVTNKSDREKCRRALGFTSAQKIVTFVGAVSPRKGADLLLEAWVRLSNQFQDAHLVVVGARKDLGRPKLKSFAMKIDALTKASGCPEHIHFPGIVDNIEDYLRASDLFVLPSRREGVPNSVLEAMGCGLPVIMCPFLGIPNEFGRPHQGQIVVQHNPEELAEAISKVLKDENLRIALGRDARQWVEKNMDLEDSLDQYKSLYYELRDRAWASLPQNHKKQVPIELTSLRGKNH